jgi:hypothetical protein
MSNSEIESYIATLDKGLAEAEEAMLREKALHNENLVIADEDGNISYVSAKEILKSRV